ncbi:MAG: hypothetical protein J0L92_38575 [Deltaproteobacteria bacterium]|nr:hypothetical protein [Deltaproteobacteria bacterium]
MTTSWKLTAAGLGLAAMASVTGCGSDGVVTADLEYVDSSITTRQDLWIDLDLENRPMTIAQLGGPREGAIAVEVEIFGPVAAAWRRSEDGVALPRNADNLVSLWRVTDVRSGAELEGRDLSRAETVDRELEGGLDYQPSNSDLPMVEGVNIEAPGDRLASEHPGENLYVLVDWRDRLGFLLNREDVELMRMLSESHPGCL